MDLGALNDFMENDDWKNGALTILKLEASSDPQTTYTPEYLTIKSHIFEEISASKEALQFFLEFINSTNEKREYFRILINIFNRKNKFNASFQVISHAITSFEGGQFFYRQKINLHSKLDERKEAYDTAVVFCNRFPKQSYGYLKLIQTLLLLKRKKEAIDAFELHKDKLDNKQKLKILSLLKRLNSIDKLCNSVLKERPKSPFWLANKLYISIKLLKPNDVVLNCLNNFTTIRALKPQDYNLLIPSAKINHQVRNRLFDLYEHVNSKLKSVIGISNFVQNIKDYKTYTNKPISSLKKPATSKVDLVYTWVDMADENFLSKFKEATGSYPNKSDNFQQNQVRYTNIGEILFALKTVQSFFKEVNHIYIVTNDQVFNLDFLEPSFQDKITFVFQKDIMPEKYVNQTVFDSNLIEAFLWNIDGLTETFIYCCDDYFFGAPIQLNKHVFSKEGIPYAIVTPQRKLNLEFNEALANYAKESTKFQTFRHNANKAYLKYFDEAPPFTELHVPLILSKKACEAAFNIFANDWQNTFFKNTLRSNNSVYAIRLFIWYALQEGYQIPGPFHLYSKKSIIFTSGIDEENTKLLFKINPLFICANFLLDEESKKQFQHISENYLTQKKPNIDFTNLKTLFENGNYQEFISLSSHYINSEKCPFWLLRFEALAHLRLNNSEQAMTVIKRAKLLYPENPNANKIMVNILMKKKEWESAEKILIEDIQIQNFNLDAYRRLINCYAQTDKIDQIIKLSALSLKDKNTEEINYLIARKLIDLKEYNNTNLVIQQSFSATSVKAITLKILVDVGQEKYESAKKNIQNLFQNKDFDFDAIENIPIHVSYCNVLIEKEEWESAEKNCKLYINKFPKSLQFRTQLLSVYNSTNESKKYTELLEDTYSRHGHNKPWLLNKYVNHLQLINEDEKALQILKDNKQHSSQVFKLLSKIYLGKGDFVSFLKLAELPNLEAADKIILLEGTINNYLSLGYFKTIPPLINSILNIETENSESFETKCTALNLGNRFYNFINSPIINTNLALSEKDKTAIKNRLNEINYHFNTATLTHEIIQTASSEIKDDVQYFIKLIKSYFEKLNSYNNVWLNTYEDPKHAFELADNLKNRIDNKTPTSLIRLGDGEGNYMPYPDHLKELQAEDQEAIQAIWWKNSIFTDPKIKADFCTDLENSIANSDIIGILPHRRLYRILGRILTLNKLGRSHRGAVAIMESITKNNHFNKIFTSSHSHFDLETWDLYNYILSGVKKVSVITCHHSLKEYITKRFGIKEVEIIDIPSEKKYAQLFGYSEEADHYPERYQEILQQVAGCEKGQVFLVAAGFLGKIYCNKIKAAGGIGIDIGSIADNWLNFKTRINDKIPPLKNGIRFDHEINNQIVLPLEGQLNFTNHYCNKQITNSKNNLRIKNFDFLIVGHPRSGTKFISTLFQKFGFKVGHEIPAENGVCSWLHAASNLNTPYFGYQNIGKYKPSRYEMNPQNILLLIRHPKNIIPSIILENGILLSYNYRRYHIYETAGIDLDHYESTLEKAIVSYLEWIQMIEKQNVDSIIRLEYAQADIIQFFRKKNIHYHTDFDEESIINRNATKGKFGVQKPAIDAIAYQTINKDLLVQLTTFCKKYSYDLDFLKKR